jgi:hypothetical protein
MIGIRIKALAAKQAKKEVLRAKLGMLPLLLPAFLFGMALGFHRQSQHDADIRLLQMSGGWYSLPPASKRAMPLRKIKCVGPCSVNRDGETLTVLTFPEHECDALPGEQDPAIKRMGMRQ